MTFDDVLEQVIQLLQHQGRVSYRALQRRFALDDDYLEDLKEELIHAQRLAADEDSRFLVWTGDAGTILSPVSQTQQTTRQSDVQTARSVQTVSPPPQPHLPDAERRQLTVLFCDLVDSTPLARQLGPEDYREVVRAYQATCGDVIQHFDGYIAQYLGDGLLVYFGYPQAHEDDAQRAVRAGLAMLDAMASLTKQLAVDKGIRLAVRLGIHTGLVVIGALGSGERQEALAIGDTPNIAARLQGLTVPDTMIVSDATWRLVQGYFTGHDLGPKVLKGVQTPMQVYRVLGTSGTQSRLDVVRPRGLTPLVGRVQEVELLLERWASVREGMGQVVLLEGEAGIGKSRLVQVLKEHVAGAGHAWLECQGSPYYQHTALYPLTELLARRLLPEAQEVTATQKVQHLEEFLVQHGLPLAETVPLFALLLSLPLPATYTPVQGSPEQQRQQTLHALLDLLLRLAAEQPLLLVMEDLHWVDPSTLAWLSLLVDQGPTARILALCSYRPDFCPPWTERSHLTQVTLSRLPQRQTTELTHRVAQGKALPAEVVAQIVAKTDGVPLFVEELTKAVLESGLLQEQEDHYALTGPLPPLAIPVTLHDSLLARLDRLGAAKGLAQLGATLGREFSYALLQAVAPGDEATVRRELQRLVAAELLYQRGLPPQATYVFKHALIQEAAYQSLLKRTRQQYHQHIAQVLKERFPETITTHPELLAQHCTEAGLMAQALPYWEQAGERAIQRSAYVEAISHLTRGLEVLKTLPDTPERVQQELTLQLALNHALLTVKGYAAPEVETTVLRIQELCQQMGETPQIFTVVYSLFLFYMMRGKFQTMRQLAEQYYHLAQSVQDLHHLTVAHTALGWTVYLLGEFTSARTHVEQAMALYDQQIDPRPTVGTYDPRVDSLSVAAWILWQLGYPDQALQRSHEALDLARGLSHPYSLAFALGFAAMFHVFRREAQVARERAEAVMTLATEQGFAYWLAYGTAVRGWALAEQGQVEEGMAQLQQGLTAYRAMGAELGLTWFLTMLAEAHEAGGQVEDGLRVLTEALDVVDKRGERDSEAELYRLQGEFMLQSNLQRLASNVHTLRAAIRHQHTEAAAAECFWKAIETARQQSAKVLELRATMSLSRLWQHQDRRTEAYDLLAPVYGWFTEGFDTADLREAKALLVELA